MSIRNWIQQSMPECGSRCLLSAHWPVRGLSGQADDEGSSSWLKALLILPSVHTRWVPEPRTGSAYAACNQGARNHARDTFPDQATVLCLLKVSGQKTTIDKNAAQAQFKLSTNHLNDNGCNSWGKLAGRPSSQSSSQEALKEDFQTGWGR